MREMSKAVKGKGGRRRTSDDLLRLRRRRRCTSFSRRCALGPYLPLGRRHARGQRWRRARLQHTRASLWRGLPSWPSVSHQGVASA